MKYLVGGSRGLFEVNNDVVKKVFTGHLYGVSFDQNYIYACQRVQQGTKILKFSKNYKVLQSETVRGNSVHQCHFDVKTQRLFVTITRNDELLEFDVEKFKEIKRHKWAGKGHYEHHCNSIWRDPINDSWYVYEQNIYGHTSKYQGGVHRLNDKFEIESTWEIGDRGHNVVAIDHYLWIVNSFKKCLSILDMDLNQIDNPIDVSEYKDFAPRGLAMSSGHILIGLTELASRADRKKTRKGLIVTYDRGFNKINELEIDSGQMYEVRFLDRIDYAHNKIIL